MKDVYRMSPAYIGESEGLHTGAVVGHVNRKVEAGEKLGPGESTVLYDGKDGLLHDVFIIWGLIKTFAKKAQETIVVIFPTGEAPNLTPGEEDDDGDY